MTLHCTYTFEIYTDFSYTPTRVSYSEYDYEWRGGFKYARNRIVAYPWMWIVRSRWSAVFEPPSRVGFASLVLPPVGILRPSRHVAALLRSRSFWLQLRRRKFSENFFMPGRTLAAARRLATILAHMCARLAWPRICAYTSLVPGAEEELLRFSRAPGTRLRIYVRAPHYKWPADLHDDVTYEGWAPAMG